MANTTFKAANIGKPAPRWYRITRRVLNLVTAGSILGGTLTYFGISDSAQVLIMGWLVLSGEIIGAFLANGEVYTQDVPPAPIPNIEKTEP